MPIEERHPQQTFNYSPSLCVAYTEEQDGINKTKFLILSINIFCIFRNINY
jgi:hypothetical protein